MKDNVFLFVNSATHEVSPWVFAGTTLDFEDIIRTMCEESFVCDPSHFAARFIAAVNDRAPRAQIALWNMTNNRTRNFALTLATNQECPSHAGGKADLTYQVTEQRDLHVVDLNRYRKPNKRGEPIQPKYSITTFVAPAIEVDE